MVAAVRDKYGDLGGWPAADKLPIVYNRNYNISFWGEPVGCWAVAGRCGPGRPPRRRAISQPPPAAAAPRAGLERLHPFDSKKFKRVLALLEGEGLLTEAQLVEAHEASHAVLREVHSERYLSKLNSSPLKVAMVSEREGARSVPCCFRPAGLLADCCPRACCAGRRACAACVASLCGSVAPCSSLLPCPPCPHQVTEMAPLLFLPSAVLRRKLLRPMATMAGGSMLAAALAMRDGWAIQLGGGMHHAAPDDGGGWCPYADIWLALQRLRQASGGLVSKALVVDLDVHQVFVGRG